MQLNWILTNRTLYGNAMSVN